MIVFQMIVFPMILQLLLQEMIEFGFSCLSRCSWELVLSRLQVVSKCLRLMAASSWTAYLVDIIIAVALVVVPVLV